jgi:hypothetical protein
MRPHDFQNQRLYQRLYERLHQRLQRQQRQVIAPDFIL